MTQSPLLQFEERGIYCPVGDFYIDPWRPVKRAVITHAHSDHARFGCETYLCHTDTLPLLQGRLGPVEAEGLPFGHTIMHNGVGITLHPAGHIVGSAQVLVEHRGERWVVSGDYKLERDGVSTPFEPVACDVFVSESTFGLPIYRWEPQASIFADIATWWSRNAELGKTSIILAYSLGKAQRVLANLDLSIGPVFAHGAVQVMTDLVRLARPELPPLPRLEGARSRPELRKALILAPPSALGTPWMRSLEPYSVAVASGWMVVRGARRRRGIDRGFALSDHADWDGLQMAIAATGASRVVLTHGFADALARWLSERGLAATVEQTQFEGDALDVDEATPVAEPADQSNETTS